MPRSTNHPPRDPLEVTTERIAQIRLELLGVISECLATYGFAQTPHAIVEAINKALWAAEDIGQDHSYLKRTRPGAVPDPDRAPDRRAPDRRPISDDDDTVPGILRPKRRI